MPVIEGGQVLRGGQDFGGVLGGQVLYGGQEIEPEQGGRTQPESEAVEMSVGPFRYSGAPPNGWYNGVADKGATAVDITTGTQYRNTGTKTATVWEAQAPSFVRATVTLTAAQVRAIADTPITLVAGVAGEAHPLVSWGSVYRAGTQAFSNGANIVLGVGLVANGWYENSFNHAAAASVLQGTDNIFRARGMAFNDSYGSDIPLAQLEGQPIGYLLEPSSAPNTPFSGGNGTLLLWVIYARIPTA